MMRTKNQSSIMKLARLMGPHKAKLLFCVCSVLLVNGAELVKPYVLKILIDDFFIGKQAEAGLHSIPGLGILYFTIIAVGALAAFSQAMLINRIGQGILHELRVKVFTHIHHMPLAILDRYGSGRLITRATNDVETLNEFYSDVLVNLFRDVFLLIGIVVVMLQMDWRLALVGFVTIPLIVLVTVSLRKKLRENFVVMKRLIGQINGFFAENIAGMRIVQAFNRQTEKLADFRALNKEYYRSTMVQVIMNGFLRPMMEVINSLAIALLVAYGYNAINSGVLEVGVLFAFTTYIKQFFEPINDLAEKYTTIQSALVSADRIYELLDDTAGQEDLTTGHVAPLKGRVEFRDVWFAYEESAEPNWVLKGVSFIVEVGERVAFVGATGAGKSTIINLISRFYVPQRGQILVDDIPIEDWQLCALRAGVAVVLQDVFLFSGTIAENVHIYSDISDEKVQESLRLSMAERFVMQLPGQLEAEVTERGSTLSSGERQLLSFARAIAHDPAILVLDEATASIDTQTELLIQESIANISRGRTSIFIAHRLSTIRECDCIHVLERGLIVESGNHEALMEKAGVYAALYQAQFEEIA